MFLVKCNLCLCHLLLLFIIYTSIPYTLITMPRPRVSDLSQRSRNAVRQQITENQLNEEDREIAREERRVNMAQRRATLTPEERDAARETARLAMRNRRAFLRYQQRFARRNFPRVDLKLAAFQYDSTMNYSSQLRITSSPYIGE